MCHVQGQRPDHGVTPLRQGFVVQAGFYLRNLGPVVKPRDDNFVQAKGKVKILVIPAQAGTGSVKFFYLQYLGAKVKPRDDNFLYATWFPWSSSGVTPLRQGFVVQAGFYVICYKALPGSRGQATG